MAASYKQALTLHLKTICQQVTKFLVAGEISRRLGILQGHYLSSLIFIHDDGKENITKL